MKGDGMHAGTNEKWCRKEAVCKSCLIGTTGVARARDRTFPARLARLQILLQTSSAIINHLFAQLRFTSLQRARPIAHTCGNRRARMDGMEKARPYDGMFVSFTSVEFRSRVQSRWLPLCRARGRGAPVR